MLTVDGDPDPFAENFVTFPKPGIYHVFTKQPVQQLEARSLAGKHKVTVTRSPIG